MRSRRLADTINNSNQAHQRVQALAEISRSALCCHSNETRAPIANLPNSAQLGGIPFHSPELHPGPCNGVGMRPRTDRQTHRRAWPQYISRRLRLTRNVIRLHAINFFATTAAHCELAALDETVVSAATRAGSEAMPRVRSSVAADCCEPFHIIR